MSFHLSNTSKYSDQPLLQQNMMNINSNQIENGPEALQNPQQHIQYGNQNDNVIINNQVKI